MLSVNSNVVLFAEIISIVYLVWFLPELKISLSLCTFSAIIAIGTCFFARLLILLIHGSRYPHSQWAKTVESNADLFTGIIFIVYLVWLLPELMVSSSLSNFFAIIALGTCFIARSLIHGLRRLHSQWATRSSRRWPWLRPHCAVATQGHWPTALSRVMCW